MPAMLRTPLSARSGRPGRDRQTLALSACPRPGSPACCAAAGEALAGPGQSSELTAPIPPGFDARPGPRSGEGGRQPSCKRRAGWLRTAPSSSPTCIPRPFCALAARPCACPPPPRCPLGLLRALPRAQGPGRAGAGAGGAGGGERRAAPAAAESGEMQPLGKALQGRGRAPHKSGEE